MGEEGFGSGEWIGEGIDKATPASLNDTMTMKPAPHKAGASGLMPANKDKAMTTKPAPHEAVASGQMPAYKDEAMTTKLAPHEAAASGQMPADEDKPLVHNFFCFYWEGWNPLRFFLTFNCSIFFCLHLSDSNRSNTRPLQVEECRLTRQ